MVLISGGLGTSDVTSNGTNVRLFKITFQYNFLNPDLTLMSWLFLQLAVFSCPGDHHHVRDVHSGQPAHRSRRQDCLRRRHTLQHPRQPHEQTARHGHRYSRRYRGHIHVRFSLATSFW